MCCSVILLLQLKLFIYLLTKWALPVCKMELNQSRLRYLDVF